MWLIRVSFPAAVLLDNLFVGIFCYPTQLRNRSGVPLGHGHIIANSHLHMELQNDSCNPKTFSCLSSEGFEKHVNFGEKNSKDGTYFRSL